MTVLRELCPPDSTSAHSNQFSARGDPKTMGTCKLVTVIRIMPG